LSNEIWPSPAKLNLFLHITGRREDGYHLLQTAFQLLDFGDSIHLQIRGDGQIERPVGANGVAPQEDLVVRAAHALKAATGCSQGAVIEVHKRTPMGAGLGGGSSNAATVLVALNAMWRCGLEPDQLAAIGVTLGADVPVFVHGHSAFGSGIGEILAPLELPQRWFLVATPSIEVSTRSVFTDSGLTRNTAPLTIASWLAGAPTRNDCWPVVRQKYLAISALADRLSLFGEARLSGTGSSVFVGFSNQQAAEAAQQHIKDVPSFVAAGVNHSPLLQARDRYLRQQSK
jgi:4-diphosphocytidyl-2-C-methyl-D-erythritol kinase